MEAPQRRAAEFCARIYVASLSLRVGYNEVARSVCADTDPALPSAEKSGECRAADRSVRQSARERRSSERKYSSVLKPLHQKRFHKLRVIADALKVVNTLRGFCAG